MFVNDFIDLWYGNKPVDNWVTEALREVGIM